MIYQSVRERISLSVVHLDRYSLDLIQQPVQRMENGNLTSGSVIQCVKVITINSSPCIQGVATCKHPFLNTSVGSSLHILNYTDLELAVVGTTVSFNCSKANEILIGPNTATCIDNG